MVSEEGAEVIEVDNGVAALRGDGARILSLMLHPVDGGVVTVVDFEEIEVAVVIGVDFVEDEVASVA